MMDRSRHFAPSQPIQHCKRVARLPALCVTVPLPKVAQQSCGIGLALMARRVPSGSSLGTTKYSGACLGPFRRSIKVPRIGKPDLKSCRRRYNQAMTLSEFKRIWYIEYLHRMWGRTIGAIFYTGATWLWWRGWLSRRAKGHVAVLGVGLAFQGALGWFMVRSGLHDQPHVSQYRLAAHLGTALLWYSLSLWSAMSHLAYQTQVQMSRDFGAFQLASFPSSPYRKVLKKRPPKIWR